MSKQNCTTFLSYMTFWKMLSNWNSRNSFVIIYKYYFISVTNRKRNNLVHTLIKMAQLFPISKKTLPDLFLFSWVLNSHSYVRDIIYLFVYFAILIPFFARPPRLLNSFSFSQRVPYCSWWWLLFSLPFKISRFFPRSFVFLPGFKKQRTRKMPNRDKSAFCRWTQSWEKKVPGYRQFSAQAPIDKNTRTYFFSLSAATATSVYINNKCDNSRIIFLLLYSSSFRETNTSRSLFALA